MQVKLLRAIQEKSVRAIGAEVEIDVDVRLMSATHKDLHKAVEMGQFRSDLFYRLNVIDIHMPSLRDRKEDIKGHADHIIADINNARTDAAPIVLGAEALDRLLGYDFPGNVRELENILERASTLCEKNLIAPEDLKLVSTGIHSLTKVSQTPMNSLDDHLDEIEKDMLIDALEKTQWNKTEAARKLGISFRSIRYRLKKLGLNED
jgi:two-component system response regulator PilR (NtrC family)